MQERRSIAFERKKLRGSQLRWPTHEKELFGVVHYLKVWRHYLQGQEIYVFTDNISLKYFETKALSTSKELTWYDVIASINVVFIHKFGHKNLVLDVLNRKEELMTLLMVATSQDDTPFEIEVKEGYKDDEEAIELNKMFGYQPIPRNGLSFKFARLKIVKKVRGLIYYKERKLYLPKGNLRKKIMNVFQDTL